jgi:uncharacterized membrane protein
MNANRYFSFSRLGLVMKRDLMENWKTNLYLFLGVFLAFLGVYLLQMYDYNDSIHGGVLDAYQTVERYVSHHTTAFAGVTLFLLVYFATETMRNMRTKEQRLSYLMLPATKLEKFVSRALYVTVGMFSMILLSSLLAEAVHWAFMPFFDELPDKFKVCVWLDAWGKIFDDLNPFKATAKLLVNKNAFVLGGIMGGTVALWWHSLYILGGNYFGKYAFFKTTGIIILVAILLAMGISHIDFDFGPGTFEWLDDFMRNNEDWLNENFVAGVITFIFFCFTVCNWWLSYELFTRQQVVKPKFRLL